jgi:hypothetical protein
MQTKGLSECDIQNSILDYLTLIGVFAWKNSSTGTYDSYRKIWRPKRGFNIKGSADILACYEGRFLAIEVKRPSTRKNVSEDQSLWLEMIVRHGGFAGVCCSIDEAIELMGDLKNGKRLDGYWRTSKIK